MKRFVTILICLLFSSAYSQIDTTFTELRGMEDSVGNTHLFYRQQFEMWFYTSNAVYHWDLQNNVDTLMLSDFWNSDTLFFHILSVTDYQTWPGDPSRYLYCGYEVYVDPVAYISRQDTNNVFTWLGEVENVEISQQDPNLAYAALNYSVLKSIDGGYTWQWGDSLGLQNCRLLRIHPKDDNIFFSEMNYDDLYKSTDGGFTYQLVDTVGNWSPEQVSFLFDRDSLHILAKAWHNLFFSADGGDTWQSGPADTVKMYIALDDSISGNYYYSRGGEIFESSDYGMTWSPLIGLNRTVVGLYKKPGTSILYAATTKDIYEITNGNAISLKHLIVSLPEPPSVVTEDFALYQNYPNPFNPSTTIEFDVEQTCPVTLKIFDIQGREMTTLVDQTMTPGNYKATFNGSNLASGIYFYRIKMGGYTAAKKMLLSK
jgi:hypothetical protein